MKLNEDFILETVADEHFLIPVGDSVSKLRGLIRCNETGQFILDCLKNDTTEDAIIAAMQDEYDVSTEDARAAIEKTLNMLRPLGALYE